MAHNPPKLSDDVGDAMDTVYHPGMWDERDGEIIIGIEGSFNGYALEAGVVRDQLEAWTVLAKHYGIAE